MKWLKKFLKEKTIVGEAFPKAFEEKKEFVPPSTIESNPPAKAAALYYRKQIRTEKSESGRIKLLERINAEIRKGEFELKVHLNREERYPNYGTRHGMNHQALSSKQAQMILVGARQLRALGFKVTIKTNKRPRYDNESLYDYGIPRAMGLSEQLNQTEPKRVGYWYDKVLTISWDN